MLVGADGVPPEWLRRAVATVDFDAAVPAILESVLTEHLPAGRGVVPLEAAVRASIAAHGAILRSLLTGRITAAQIVTPAPALAGAVEWELDLPQGAVHRAYRVGLSRFWHLVVEAVRPVVEREQIPGSEVFEAMVAAERLVVALEDHVVERVVRAHVAEEEVRRASREQLRRRALRSLLAGDETQLVDEVSHLLRYDIAGAHLAVLLPDRTETATGAVVAALRSAIGATGDPLLLPVNLSATAFWLGRDTPWPPSWRAAARGALSALDLEVSVGEPASGADGFRATYEQAQRAESVRGRIGATAPPVMMFHDVRLDWFFLDDLEAARIFVREELGGLAERSERAGRLRETVQVWLETGSNVATAAALDLHEHTVRNRLRQAEEILGHALTERRTEVQVALRLHRMAPHGVAAD